STAVSTAAPIDPSIAAPAAAKLPATTAASASGCQLQITSNASLADIWIDGVRKGKVPALLEVPCQATEVALRHPRYSADSRRVTPTAGLTEVALRLTRPLVTVKILSTPPGATVRVNGRELGKTPAQAKVHAFERGTIVLSHNGGAIKTMQIYPQADNTVVSATLPKPRAKPRK
ncbi:MAG TPA: PEGA domain-containing protein, partial [Kofleriaceae bacterium]|nr:PEGA domain-containing protein [Kofleriaceae bacterium]